MELKAAKISQTHLNVLAEEPNKLYGTMTSLKSDKTKHGSTILVLETKAAKDLGSDQEKLAQTQIQTCTCNKLKNNDNWALNSSSRYCVRRALQ